MNASSTETRQGRRLEIEDRLFRDFEQTARMMDKGSDDPQVDRVHSLVEVTKGKTIFQCCTATPITGCGKVAKEIVVPLYGEQFIVAHARFSCGQPECTQIVQDSFRVPSEVLEFSLEGIAKFNRHFGAKKVTNRLAQLLAQKLGIMFDTRPPKHEALMKFFGNSPSHGTQEEVE